MMINGLDINPLATEMHLREIEREVRRARGETREYARAGAERSGGTILGRVFDWWKRPAAAHDVAAPEIATKAR